MADLPKMNYFVIGSLHHVVHFCFVDSFTMCVDIEICYKADWDDQSFSTMARFIDLVAR